MVASRKRAQAREREVAMRQLRFEFFAASGVPLDPRTEAELIARMAEWILAIVEAERGGTRNEEPPTES